MSVSEEVEELAQCSQRPSKPGARGFRASRSVSASLATSAAFGLVKEYFHSQRRKSLPTAASFPGFFTARAGLSLRAAFKDSGSATFLKRNRMTTFEAFLLRLNPMTVTYPSRAPIALPDFLPQGPWRGKYWSPVREATCWR